MQRLQDVASNQMTTQQVEVKDNQLLMNDPYTVSLSLEAMTPNPGAVMCLLVRITKIWTGAICCNREKTPKFLLGLAQTS